MKKIVLPLLILFLCSCSAKTVKTDFFAMDTFMSISLLGSDADMQVAEEEILTDHAYYYDRENGIVIFGSEWREG